MMRVFNLSVAGAVASIFLFGSIGSVSAQDLFEADPIDLQFERDVRSTYIVRLANSLPSQAVNNRANEVAARFGGRIKYTYTNTINGFAITMPSVAMTRMIEAGGLDIISVTRDGIVTIDAKPDAPGGERGKPIKPPKDGPTLGTCAEEVPWGVKRVTSIDRSDYEISSSGEQIGCEVTEDSHPASGPPVAIHPDYSKGGAATRVCVIDTGVSDHPDLNLHKDWSHNSISNENRFDRNGHGSHVAGTIGAWANDVGVVGVAPGASIVSVKVLNRRGSGSWSGVIDGIDAMVGANVCPIANMSSAGPIMN